MNETILIVIAAAALGLAIAMGLILGLVLREERRRSNTRAALLAGMAAEGDDDVADGILLDDPADDLEIVHTPGAELFAPAPARSPWPQRLAIAGILAVLLVGVTLVTRALPSRPAPAVAAGAPAVPQQAAPLELLSLRHAQQGDSMAITGLVQNPRSGAPLTKITATAMLFGADGALIASSRTPLDATTLRPGDESGFVITVPVTGAAAGTVARYRVGFRGEDGRVIGHVDRRESPPIARGPS
jgi:hypothetical protein